MNRPKIAKLTEEIALVRNSYEFMEELEFSWNKFIEELATLIIWLTPIFYYLLLHYQNGFLWIQ